jgi:hypothetical protein
MMSAMGIMADGSAGEKKRKWPCLLWKERTSNKDTLTKKPYADKTVLAQLLTL